MNHTSDHIRQLEEENKALKKQLSLFDFGQSRLLHLNDILKFTGEVIVQVKHDGKGTVEYISDSISLYGYSSDEFMSGKLSYWDIIYPNDLNNLQNNLGEQANSAGGAFRTDYRIYSKSKQIIRVAGTVTPVFGQSGTVDGYLFKNRNINKRKQDGEGLQDARENLATALNSVGEAVIFVDTESRIERLNGAAELLLGIINLKARNKHLRDIARFCFSADFSVIADLLKMEAETCNMVQVDEIFMQCVADGRKLRVSCNVSTVYAGDDTDAPTGYVLVVKDLTMIHEMLQAARKNEDRVQESESTIRGVFEHSADGIVLVDREGTVREWSRGYEVITGISKEQAVGQPLWDVISAILPSEQQNDREYARMKAELQSVCADVQQRTIIRHVVNRQTGEYRILNVQYFPVKIPGKMMTGAISRDVTGEMQSNELIRQNEQNLIAEKERLQALGDNFPKGTLFRFKMNMQTETMSLDYVGGTWEKTLGISAGESLADIWNVFGHVHPDDLSYLMDGISQSVNTLQNIDHEVRYLHPGGSEHWYQISSHPHRKGNTVYSDGFILDITERKRTETELTQYREELELLVKERTEELETANEELYATNEELYATNEEYAVTNEELHSTNDQLKQEIAARKEVMMQLEDSESKIRNFIQQSFEGIMILDNEGRIIEWNHALEQITGLPHDEVIGQSEGELLRQFRSKEDSTPEVYGKAYRTRQEYFRGGRNQQPVIEEQVLNMPDGSKRYMQVSMFPIGLAETCYFGHILRDITEQKMADMELEQYRTQLEQMVESKTRELFASQDRLVSLSNNLPGGVIYQFMDKDADTGRFSYVSAYFADMFEIGVEEVMADSTLFYAAIYPEDRLRLMEAYRLNGEEEGIDMEYRILVKSGKTKWIHIRSGHHYNADGFRVWDGFMIDITDRKIAEQELEAIRKRQSILIKVLQIVQSAESIPDALNKALAEIGRYINVSRTYVFEKSADGKTARNTYEWCNTGVKPEIHNLQEVPIEYMADWFAAFAAGTYICASDLSELSSVAQQQLTLQGIKSILVLPLVLNGVNYGFVGYDECSANRKWEQNEISLLISLSQIIVSTTRRYWAETSMRLSQQTMRTVLDNIDGIIYVSTFDTMEILFANKKLKDEMGQDIEGKTCWQILQRNKSTQCEFCPNSRLLDASNRPTGIYRWEAWNENTKRWYECTDAAVEWVDGRMVHMEYATDITSRRLTENALRESEELYRQLTVASPDAIVVCTPEGQIRYVSPKAIELFGIEDGVDPGALRMLQYVHPHDRLQAQSTFGMLVRDHAVFPPQFLLVKQDGSEFFGEISAATVKDSDGNVASVIMVIRDITRRKMDEIELIRAKEKAEESDKLKSAFLANMSHEIRTPINGIIGFLNFLADDNLTPKRRQEYINVVNNNSVQLVKLIDDIIDVAKIEARQMTIRPVPFRVNELMGELQVFFETYLQANNKDRVALILDDSRFIDNCVAFVDPIRLRQVLSNLIGNAIKFTEKGFIRFGYRQSAPGMLEFVVEDSGIGLASDQLEVIFERFRQAELNNNRRYGGTGLGLTISHSLAQLMGGDMHVESIEGEGSSFYFTLSYIPVNKHDEHLFDDLNDDGETNDKPFKKMVILVVEPETMKSKYYEKLLTSAGATLLFAKNAQQWLDTISQRNHIDVVLTDAAALENAGDDMLRQIRAIRAGLPLVLAVPERNGHYNRLISEIQCNKVVVAPVDFAALFAALKRYM